MAYLVYFALSIIFSLIVAFLPTMIFFFWSMASIDSFVNGLGWPFADIQSYVAINYSSSFPSFFFDYFWFLVFLPLIGLISYGFFIAFLMIMFRISRRVIPTFEDGWYGEETDAWYFSEMHQAYYTLLPHFISFFNHFLDSRIRHQWFGTKLGPGTWLGNATLFTPERVEVGENCIIGFGSVLTGHVYQDKRLYLQPVKIGNNVTVGGYAIVFPGAVIGDNVIIGANTVVPPNRVIPPNSIWVKGKAVPRKDLSGKDPIIVDGMDGDVDIETLSNGDSDGEAQDA